MAEVHPVSIERHGNCAWSKVPDFSWARADQVMPISLPEASNLLTALPLAFLLHESEYQFLALLGLRPNENLWVALDGRWLAPHVPALMQHYPFRLLRSPEGQSVLGVDEVGLLPRDASGGSPLYDDEGKPVSELSRILQQLTQADIERQQTCKIANVLARHDLLEPWDLQIAGDGETRKIAGLYRVNEKKLNEVPVESLLELRNTRALVMAYCQLLSIQHVQNLGRLAEAHAKARERTAQTTKIAANEHGIISFANL